MAINQAYIFIIFSINGLIIGLFFDFFRILRKSFKTKNYITYIEDFIFWILTGISIIFFMYNFSDGNLRVYILLGIILGFALYILLFSKIIINIFVKCINFIKNLISSIFKKLFKFIIEINKIINIIFLHPINLLFNNIRIAISKKCKKNKIFEKNVKI